MDKELTEKEGIEKANKIVNAFAKILQETYGRKWNFEIDIIEGGDTKRNFSLRVKIYKR